MFWRRRSFSYLAQDVVSWLIARVGAGRTNKIVDFMWRNHAMYESDFSVLNTLLRGFMNVGRERNGFEVRYKESHK